MDEAYVVLLAFVLWTVMWIFVMLVLRMKVAIPGKVKITEFTHTGAEISPLMQRVSRVHANCLENLPIFASVVFVAAQTGTLDIINGLVWVYFGARVLQSLIHASSVSKAFIMPRAMCFWVQVGLTIYWSIQILLTIT
ncbi:MAG: hypothetical protein COB14_06745 [Alphaproteobacteria bacterium]|nr:MAG: hypothetical protein COB14_06745 [Alphaproteobacteria bacterium]